jgi:eukaryotic-like serine/threonine-protein kinase
MSNLEARKYRIVSVLGQGGFGKVYRAQLEGAEGFRKDVALKLLKDGDIPDEQLARFRDEARILGLVRDRAIVNVDPPTRLSGRLAVVMEYVDGVATNMLLKASPFPPSVALELVQEVCRVLDKVYDQAGPDGTPLHLLHRDLKPGNLQLTPSGEVKILDFGIAKAAFDGRESVTQNISGTMGYMAPERFEGVESPAGDVYSLGVVLHVLVTGDKALGSGGFQPKKGNVERTADVQAALALAAEMRNVDHTARPTMRQVEDRCQALRTEFPGISLRRWAEANVPKSLPLDPDDLVGNTLTERVETMVTAMPTGNTGTHTTDTARTASIAAAAATIGVVAVTLVAFGALLAVAAGLFGVWWTSPPGVAVGVPDPVVEPAVAEPPPVVEPAPVEAVATAVPTPAEDPALATPPAEAPVETAAPEPPPVPVEVATTAKVTRPAKVEPAKVEPAKVEPAKVDPPAASAPKWKVTFTSVPLGAAVTIDGVEVGKTPLFGYELTSGEHKVVMRSASGTIEKSIRAGNRAPARYVWEGGDQWNSFY